MDRVNRWIVVVELVVAIVLMPFIIALILTLSPALVESTSTSLRALVTAPSATYTQAIGLAVAVLVFVLALLLLFLEFQRPSLRGLRVQQVNEGQVQVTAEAITQRLEQELINIPDVTRIKPFVVSAKKGLVDLFLEIETSPEVNIPQKTQEVINAAKHVMEERMGLALGKIQVQVDHTRPRRGAFRGPKANGQTNSGAANPKEAMMIEH